MNAGTRPLVSVIIPTYNHAHFLGRAMQSVLDQTYTNWEAIVIDNHSRDHTEEVVRSFADPRITLIKNHNNGVIAVSRNMGIRAAKGDWIAFLDSDDSWMRNKLAVCLEHSGDGVGLIYHDLDILRDHATHLQRRKIKTRQVQSPVLFDLLINGNQIANSSVVVRKSLIDQVGGIDENPKMVASEDYNTWLRIAQFTDAFLYIPQTLGSYRIHEAAVSNRNTSFSDKGAIAPFLNLLSDSQHRRIDARLAYISGSFHYGHRNYLAATKELKVSLRWGHWPIKLKSLYMIVGALAKRVSI
ncbi:MAG: glycosyltransferase [Burkholderiales bacterium]|nr:glycosyltransferase [Burkholderiales bacterium]